MWDAHTRERLVIPRTHNFPHARNGASPVIPQDRSGYSTEIGVIHRLSPGYPQVIPRANHALWLTGDGVIWQYRAVAGGRGGREGVYPFTVHFLNHALWLTGDVALPDRPGGAGWRRPHLPLTGDHALWQPCTLADRRRGVVAQGPWPPTMH